METLTLENICPYLPYGLKIDTSYYDDEYSVVVGFNDYNLITWDGQWASTYGKKIEQEYSIEHVKPILRPMNLTKSIVVDGKEIIPIVELAEICCKTNDWALWNGKAQRGGYMNSEMFSYQSNNFYRWDSDGPNHVENQIVLFQKLAEWKIDFMGLIEKGLAIDAYTLDVNPYNS